MDRTIRLRPYSAAALQLFKSYGFSAPSVVYIQLQHLLASAAWTNRPDKYEAFFHTRVRCFLIGP